EHSNDWYARTARRLMQERTEQVRRSPALPPPDYTAARAELAKMATEHKDVAIRLRAIWALHVTGGLPPEVEDATWKSQSELIRSWYVQLQAEDRRIPRATLSAFARLAQDDPSPVVRRALASACS